MQQCKLQIDEPKSGLSVSLINLFCIQFSITALLQLVVSTANYAGMIDFLQPRPKDKTIAQSWLVARMTNQIPEYIY